MPVDLLDYSKDGRLVFDTDTGTWQDIETFLSTRGYIPAGELDTTIPRRLILTEGIAPHQNAFGVSLLASGITGSNATWGVLNSVSLTGDNYVGVITVSGASLTADYITANLTTGVALSGVYLTGNLFTIVPGISGGPCGLLTSAQGIALSANSMTASEAPDMSTGSWEVATFVALAMNGFTLTGLSECCTFIEEDTPATLSTPGIMSSTSLTGNNYVGIITITGAALTANYISADLAIGVSLTGVYLTGNMLTLAPGITGGPCGPCGIVTSVQSVALSANAMTANEAPDMPSGSWDVATFVALAMSGFTINAITEGCDPVLTDVITFSGVTLTACLSANVLTRVVLTASSLTAMGITASGMTGGCGSIITAMTNISLTANAMTASTAPDFTGDSWEVAVFTALALDGFTLSGDVICPTYFANAAYMLIDLDNTSVWPHTATGAMRVQVIEVNLVPSPAFSGSVHIGVVTAAGMTSGSMEEMKSWWFSGNSDPITEFCNFYPYEAVGQPPRWLGMDISGAVVLNHCNELPGPPTVTSTYNPAVGDLVMFIAVGGGSIDVAVSVVYYTVNADGTLALEVNNSLELE